MCMDQNSFTAMMLNKVDNLKVYIEPSNGF